MTTIQYALNSGVVIARTESSFMLLVPPAKWTRFMTNPKYEEKCDVISIHLTWLLL